MVDYSYKTGHFAASGIDVYFAVMAADAALSPSMSLDMSILAPVPAEVSSSSQSTREKPQRRRRAFSLL
jgi:hypothetical protein